MRIDRAVSPLFRWILAAALIVGAAPSSFAQTFGPPELLSNSITGPTDSDDDYKPEVATDGAGNWVAVWSSYDDLGGTIDSDQDIFVARSSDNGATWSAPQALNTNAATDFDGDFDPQIATDGAGNWVVVWTSYDDLGGTIGTDTDVLFARSTNNGATWTAPAILNTDAATDSSYEYSPSIAAGAGGNWVAVWTSENDLGGTIGNDLDILVAASADNGASWTAPAALNTNAATDTGFDYSPRIRTDGAGNWMTVWGSDDDLGGTIGNDLDILVAASADNGASWTAPAAVNSFAATDSDYDIEPDLATDASGNWIAVWTSDNDLGGTIDIDYDILVAVSTDVGATWTPAAALNSTAASDAESDEGPRLATDGAGTWIATWVSWNDLGGTIGNDYDVLFAVSTDTGASWGAAGALNGNAGTDSGYDYRPMVVSDGANNWVAAWYSEDPLGGTLGFDYDIFTVRSSDDGATWTLPQALNTNAFSDQELDHDPSVAADGNGNWVAIWESADTLGGTIGDDFDILVSRSSDNGATWSSPAALNSHASTDSDDDVNPRVVTDGDGNWIAVWQSDDDLGGTVGNDDDILVARSTDNGATWTAAEPLNSDAAVDFAYDQDVRVAAGAGGNWVAVWESDNDNGGTTGGDSEIRFARSTDEGATWTVPASLNSNATTDFGWDTNPEIASDGAGNMVAVWQSEDDFGGTSGFDEDIVVSRSNDDGATWSAATLLNSSATTDFESDADPAIATDGNGTWIVVWESEDDLGGTIDTDDDILVAVSTDNGATWTNQAALNSRAAIDVDGDSDPAIATDGAGTWMVAWESDDDLGGVIGDEGDILYAVSTDDGATWTAQAALNTNAAGDAGTDDDPQIASDGAGRWIAVWESEDGLGGLASFGADDIFVAVVGPAGPCAAAPIDASMCLVAPNTKLQVADSATPGKDKLAWQWGRGEAFDQADLGTPLVDTTYALCIYDTSAMTPVLAAELEIAASATLWSSKDPKGLQYKDKAGTSDGVTKILVKTGAATKTKVKLLAKGAGLVLPAPAGMTFFEQDPRVVAQLVSSTGTCWTTEFEAADNKKHDAARFLSLTK